MTETPQTSEATELAASKPEVAYDVFASLDIRAGRIVEVQPFPRARNPSYKVAVDLGSLGIRWSSAQITSYAADELVGTQVVCITNFAPRNIAGFQSQVLILGVADEAGNVILLSPRSEVPKGNPVY
ncbi:tRNA-binding protein [Pseudochelatococcus contaminans]|uniref:tRNA-binding protein n=1 Tax=Pseudochelatococcus contaminans TaxID=1538103 RepID=A0A7W5Z6G6_9HYPH|nr:tRNA-binding protein [Pseudochelatococcus contaminans]MBB3811018.1 tRNA-binding protein [Pseudochelatococcus contaminans]